VEIAGPLFHYVEYGTQIILTELRDGIFELYQIILEIPQLKSKFKLE